MKSKRLTMMVEFKCENCGTENVVINNTLFFSEEQKDTIIHCSICNIEITKLETDGWFYVQSKEQYEVDKKIEKQKETLKCTDFGY